MTLCPDCHGYCGYTGEHGCRRFAGNRCEGDGMKCIVKGCSNHQGEGKFVDTLCAPCHTMLTQGKKMPSEAWFAKPWVGLTDEEFKKVCWESGGDGITGDREESLRAMEAILKEKNT